MHHEMLMKWRVFTQVASTQANLLEQKKVFAHEKSQSRRIGLVHRHGHRFIVLEHQYGCRDVTL